jgi:hypothetical protein
MTCRPATSPETGGEAATHGLVVAVHAGDELSSRLSEPAVERRCEPEVLLADDHKARIAHSGEQRVDGAVGAAVVDDPQLEVDPVAVAQNAEDRREEILAGVVHGQDHGHRGKDR